MINKVFSVYDAKAKAYLPPFFLHEEGLAIRAFSNCANDPDHQFGQNPEDYTLFLIGQYDDITAELIPETPSTLGNALQYKGETNGE